MDVEALALISTGAAACVELAKRVVWRGRRLTQDQKTTLRICVVLLACLVAVIVYAAGWDERVAAQVAYAIIGSMAVRDVVNGGKGAARGRTISGRDQNGIGSLSSSAPPAPPPDDPPPL